MFGEASLGPRFFLNRRQFLFSAPNAHNMWMLAKWINVISVSLGRMPGDPFIPVSLSRLS